MDSKWIECPTCGTDWDIHTMDSVTSMAERIAELEQTLNRATKQLDEYDETVAQLKDTQERIAELEAGLRAWLVAEEANAALPILKAEITRRLEAEAE